MPDDASLRLVLLPPERWYAKEAPQQATGAVQEYPKMRGDQPRHRANRLLFLAADQVVLPRLKDATRAALAWESIVKDVDEGRLNIDQNQKTQPVKESQTAAAVLPRVSRECFKWLLCPSQAEPKADQPEIEAYQLNTTAGSAADELGQLCRDNELVIEKWSPIHLRSLLIQHYWKDDCPSVAASSFWEDSLRYLFLPRLKDCLVLSEAIRAGAVGRDFFGTAYGETGGKYEGFQLGGDVSVNDTLLLIEPEAAKAYEQAQKKVVDPKPPIGDPKVDRDGRKVVPPVGDPDEEDKTDKKPRIKVTSFRGSADLPAETAQVRMAKIAEEILNLLTLDPNATIQVTLEFHANFPDSASDTIWRGVSENAASLGFKTKEWE